MAEDFPADPTPVGTYEHHPFLQPGHPYYVAEKLDDYELMQPVFGDAEALTLVILVNHFAMVERAGGPFVQVVSTYQQNIQPPAVLAINTRRTGLDAYGNNDELFMRSAVMEINTFTDGPDAETDGVNLQESVKQALMRAYLKQIHYPHLGIINHISSPLTATRQTDWATATGPVQYSKLPEGAVRYEARYKMIIRPPYKHNNEFLPFPEGHK